jgi:hypothetical protein
MGIAFSRVRDSVFGPDDTRAMGAAFEKACQMLRNGGRLIAKDVIAKRIVALAQEGERDPDRLCARALAAIGTKPD